MKHFYSTVENVTLMYDDIETNRDGLDTIDLHFEKPIAGGFAFLDMTLPTLYVRKSYGFSEDELYQLTQYAKTNAPLIWKLALEAEGGTDKIAAGY